MTNDRSTVNRQDFPTFSTPDVLNTGQTGWTLTRAERSFARTQYRACRIAGYDRHRAAVAVAEELNGWAAYHLHTSHELGIRDTAEDAHSQAPGNPADALVDPFDVLADLARPDSSPVLVWVSIGRNVSPELLVEESTGRVRTGYGRIVRAVAYGDGPYVLDPADWSSFRLVVADVLTDVYGAQLLGAFEGTGYWEGQTEDSAAWLVSVRPELLPELSRSLDRLARVFGQDAVGIVSALSASTLTGAR
jgi:hypothetical protein